MLTFTKPIITVNHNPKCREFRRELPTFPPFVLHSESLSNYSNLLDSAQRSRGQFDNTYLIFDEKNWIDVFLDYTYFLFQSSGSCADFIQHYSHVMLGDVKFANMPSFGRAKTFRVPDDLCDPDRFHNFSKVSDWTLFIFFVGIAGVQQEIPSSYISRALVSCGCPEQIQGIFMFTLFCSSS
jgi:hypothetical protein